MGYTTPWYSTADVDDPTVRHEGRIACYLRHEGEIYLTYWTTARGDEVLSPLFGLLDMTVYGRREESEDSPEGWPQYPTHWFLRTDEHGAPMGARKGGRPVPQWTRMRDARGLSRTRKAPRLQGLESRADTRTRTGDPFITSEVLYQLSYVGAGRRVAKRG